jgi:protein-S-isoprenylcysteine O-methyltransferase Ste14
MAPDPNDNRRSVGEVLFRLRGVVPLPLLAAGFVLGQPDLRSVAIGVGMAAMGEGIRMWAVAHIGSRSRTRGGQVGVLVIRGPFARCRNPLYLGNLLIGAGIVVALQVPLLVPIFVALFFVHYGLIVSWEERRLEAEHGAVYRAYRAQVPRWFPTPRRIPADVAEAASAAAPFGAWAVLRSERSTLVVWVVLFGAVGVFAALR